MAVTISNTYTNRNSTGDITVANVVVGASDNGIVVLTSVQDGNHANYPVVSVTRDGQSFTKLIHYEPSGNVRVEAWYLASPNVNTSNIVIDVTGAVGEFTAHAVVMSGVDISSLVDVYNGGSGSGFAPSVSLTTTVDDDMLLHILCAEADTSAGTGQTVIADYQDQSYENATSSYKAGGVAGSKSMYGNMASGQPYAQVAVAVKAAASGTPVDSERGSEISGAVEANAERETEIHGAVNTNNERESEVHGVSNVTNERESEIRGSIATNDERESEVSGAVAVSNERESEVTGARYTDEREAEITGKVSVQDERESEISGALSVSNERASEISGIENVTNERESEITGQALGFPTGWGRKHRITIPAAKVSDLDTADLVDFPVLLKEGNFLAEIWGFSDNGGGDIRFSTDIAGANQVPCEIVNWDTALEEAEVWVKLTLDYDGDTVFYVWYDNTGETQPAIDSTYGAENVWNSNYGAVYHLEDNTLDSTANDADGGAPGTGASYVATPLGRGLAFDGQSTAHFTVADNVGFDTSVDRLTIQVFANADSTISGAEHFINADSVQAGRRGLFPDSANGWGFQFRDDADVAYSVNEGAALVTEQWDLIHGVYNGSNLIIYVNGVSEGTDAQASKTVINLGGNTYIGRHPTITTSAFIGEADEIRFIKDALSAGWVATEATMFGAPSTFSTPSSASESDERESEVHGAVSATNERESEITGAQSVNDERESEIIGSVLATDERESEITGTKNADTRESEISGIQATNDERESEIQGALSVNDERESEVTGSIPFSTRNTEIIGKAEKEIPRIYRILVKDAAGNNVGEFERFRELSFGKRLNNYGEAHFEVPVTDSKASDLINLRSYTVWIYRQENATSTLVWAGEQAMRDVEIGSDGGGWVTIYCYTWLEQLKDRYTAAEKLYTATDAGAIAWDLINVTQTPSNGSFGITQGSITATVNRDRSYYNQNVMEAIINLANVISGFDFEITDNRVFNVYSVMGSDKTDTVVFEFGHNMSSVKITEDFVTPMNRGIALGLATDQTTLQRSEYNNVTLQGTNKIREGLISEMDVSEAATLADKAEALVRKYGTKLLKVEPNMTKASVLSITDFGLGDVIRLIVDHGIYNIDENYRVFEWEVTYNSDNSEDLSLVLGNFTL